MKFSERKGLIDRQSFVAQYVSLAVLTIGKSPAPGSLAVRETRVLITTFDYAGICTLLGSDDLLAAFACGSAFAWE